MCHNNENIRETTGLNQPSSFSELKFEFKVFRALYGSEGATQSSSMHILTFCVLYGNAPQ